MEMSQPFECFTFGGENSGQGWGGGFLAGVQPHLEQLLWRCPQALSLVTSHTCRLLARRTLAVLTREQGKEGCAKWECTLTRRLDGSKKMTGGKKDKRQVNSNAMHIRLALALLDSPQTPL